MDVRSRSLACISHPLKCPRHLSHDGIEIQTFIVSILFARSFNRSSSLILEHRDIPSTHTESAKRPMQFLPPVLSTVLCLLLKGPHSRASNLIQAMLQWTFNFQRRHQSSESISWQCHISLYRRREEPKEVNRIAQKCAGFSRWCNLLIISTRRLPGRTSNLSGVCIAI